MVRKTGIICASDTELEPFLLQMQNSKTTEIAMLKFYEGTIRNKEVVAVFSGVCKVNAAVATQIIIDYFQVDTVINAGTAGGIAEDIKVFDTVVSERVAYHDVADDILTEFHPWMPSVYFYADQTLLKLAKNYRGDLIYPIKFGTSVSGEQFITEEKREEISLRFHPLSVDMESAAAAHVCYVNQIPFISVRTITDNASHDGLEYFEENCQRASSIAAEITIQLFLL